MRRGRESGRRAAMRKCPADPPRPHCTVSCRRPLRGPLNRLAGPGFARGGIIVEVAPSTPGALRAPSGTLGEWEGTARKRRASGDRCCGRLAPGEPEQTAQREVAARS